MAKKDLKIPPRALLVAGIIYSPEVELVDILFVLKAAFGEVILEAGPVDFTWTKYYEKEMGQGLKRYFVAFDNLVDQAALPEIKLQTMTLEDKWTQQEARRVNIDPGILTLERLVLATTKNFTHRIYLGKGIYADLTLIYQKGKFSVLDWTYPDYRSQFALDFLTKARKRYLVMIKKQGKGVNLCSEA